MYMRKAILLLILLGFYFLSATVIVNRDSIEVNGIQSGIWEEDNVYQVTGNIEVLSGSQLLIEPGTTIKFMGYYDYIVNGVFSYCLIEYSD